ncbi:MAG TPA: hypothetical protein VHE54_04605 [Puia sp.]|nr:hypothetical protein [Puia sp.]
MVYSLQLLYNHPSITMYKTLLFIALLLGAGGISAQTIGRVDKKTKAFYIASDQKISYLVFGYQYPNPTTKKMICFSSSADNLRANYQCPLGAYFDTGNMGAGDKIVFLGVAGPYGKMSFISGSGKATVFYLPKTSFTIN